MRDSRTIYLLNIGNYAPEITELTYPYVVRYAKKIDAEIYEITERKFPGWPVVYEKLQIHEIAQHETKTDWHIYIDSDALIHPETIDFTDHVTPDTVIETGFDRAPVRWRYDYYFKRDGRNIGCCNWFTIASKWCLDLWRPIDDMTVEETLENIYPTVHEQNTVITREHLIDDYTLSRNIARFGLKFKTTKDICDGMGLTEANFFMHQYTISIEEKIELIKKTIDGWQVGTFMNLEVPVNA
jgi:hypothetical protein